MADTFIMNSDDLSNKKPAQNYFQHDDELTVDGSPYKKENYLMRSYVIGPLILMSVILIGSAILLSSMK
jgi:hypothetical protein